MDSLLAGGAVLLLAAVPFHILYATVRDGNLARNNAWGIRTRATLRSDDAWARGHRAAAPYILAATLVAYAGAFMCALTAAVARSSSVSDVVIGLEIGLALGSFLALTLSCARVANKAARAGGTGLPTHGPAPRT